MSQWITTFHIIHRLKFKYIPKNFKIPFIYIYKLFDGLPMYIHKLQEEVEIVAKVVGNKGKLSSIRLEVKKKDNGELIAIAKQWTASNEFRAPWINHPSKL